MDGKLLVEKLLVYARAHLFLSECDEIYMRNVLLSEFGFTEPYEGEAELSGIAEADVPDDLAGELKAFALEAGLCDESGAERYIADIFGLLSPLPSQINRAFVEIREKRGPQAACDYLYGISVKNKSEAKRS